VVKTGSALFVGEDSSSVELEVLLVGLDGNRDRAIVEGSDELVRVVALDVGEGEDLNESLGLVVLALANGSTGDVGVVGLSHEGVELGVPEGVIHEASIASVVQPGAVDEVGL